MRKIDYYASKAVHAEDDILVGAIDVETEGLGGKLLMVQWGVMGQIFTATGPDMVKELFDYVMKWPKPVVWYSHFAQYDWRYFMDYFVENKYEIDIGMRTDTDIYEIRIRTDEGDTVILRDSYALWNSPLEKLATTFCPELPKLKIDIENFNPEDPDHVEYAKRDVMILMVGLPRLFDLINEHFSVQAGATTAGTALKAWQRSLGKKEIYDCSEYGDQEEYIRQAYYGGIVFLTSTATHKNCETYDINSSYPYNMCEFGVPYGRTMRTIEWAEADMGIFRCRVRAPDDLIIPILPARDGKGRMRWYKGEFDTTVTNIELVFAVKHGYEVLEVYDGFTFEETVFPFNDLIDHCKLLRKVYKGLSVEMLAKLIQNSLYGKFGARRLRTRVISAEALEDSDFEARPLDDAGNWYVKQELDEEMRCLPQWAVFITAHARLTLLSAIYKVGPEHVIYGDTDSITLKKGFSHLINTGEEYGQFKLEKEWQVFRAIAPKVYTGVLIDGTFKGAAKGLPRKAITDQHWKELLETGHSSATTISIDSLRVAMRKGVLPARQLTRKSSNLENSSNFIALPDGTVRLKYPHEN